MIVGVARCGDGRLGVVLRRGYITYPGGTSAYAWLGRSLPNLRRRWSSRHPRWVLGPWYRPR